MAILHDDVIMMTRHNGRIDKHKQIWWDKESFNTTYNNTTVC